MYSNGEIADHIDLTTALQNEQDSIFDCSPFLFCLLFLAVLSMTENTAAGATLYIRCAGLHSRGELLNDFFYAHRVALGLQDYYTTSQANEAPLAPSSGEAEGATLSPSPSPRLPADFPVEVVYVRLSRKPYFLVEWRYPTDDEVEKQKAKRAEEAGEKEGENRSRETVVDQVSSAERLGADALAALTSRTLALAAQKKDGVAGEEEGELTWRDQPVTISAALPGMTVAAERTKLELRDAQLKTQRVAEKRARDEAESAKKKPAGSQLSAGGSAGSFVPRSVRRRA